MHNDGSAADEGGDLRSPVAGIYVSDDGRGAGYYPSAAESFGLLSFYPRPAAAEDLDGSRSFWWRLYQQYGLAFYKSSPAFRGHRQQRAGCLSREIFLRRLYACQAGN